MAEGEARIISIKVPSEFTPNVSFNIVVTAKNVGGTDDMFIRIYSLDFNKYVGENIRNIKSGYPWSYTLKIAFSQKTDIHGRVEVGHIE